MEDLRKQFAKDFSYLETGVEYAAWVMRFGSFGDRNPHLGKMVRCPFCRTRHRQAIQCCDPHYATTVRAYDPEHDVKTKASKSGPGYGPTPRHEKGFYQAPLDESAEYLIHFVRTDGKECMTERSNTMFSKRMLREAMRRHNAPRGEGKLKRQQVRDLTLEMQASVRLVDGIQWYSPEGRVVFAAQMMKVPSPKFDAIPAFAEKFWMWSRKQWAKRRRKARKTRQGA